MDGTLLDTMIYWRYTSLEYLLAHRWPVTDEVLVRMYGCSARRLLMEYAEERGFAIDRAEMVRELEDYMNRHYLYDAHLKDDDVPAFLEMLKRQGVRLCVATGSPRQYARHELERLGILPYFEFVADIYEEMGDKSRPAYFEAVARRLGTAPERCWVFEDALYAIRAAKDAGCRVCAIADGAQAADWDRIRALADLTIHGYRELLEKEDVV